MTHFLSEEELDKRGILTRTTRWRMRRAGLFPHPVKIGARRIAYRFEDIEVWAAERQTVSSTAA